MLCLCLVFANATGATVCLTTCNWTGHISCRLAPAWISHNFLKHFHFSYFLWLKMQGPGHTVFPMLVTLSLFLSCTFSLHILYSYYFFFNIYSSHRFYLYLVHEAFTWLYPQNNTHTQLHTHCSRKCFLCDVYPAPCFAVRSHNFMYSYNKPSSEKCYADKCVYLYFFSLTWESGQAHEMRWLTPVTFHVMKPHYQVLLQAPKECTTYFLVRHLLHSFLLLPFLKTFYVCLVSLWLFVWSSLLTVSYFLSQDPPRYLIFS